MPHALDEILAELKRVTRQNDEIKDQNNDIKNELHRITNHLWEEITNLKDIVENITENNRHLLVKSGKLERELKKCNIIVFGLPEEENEVVLDVVHIFIKDNLLNNFEKVSIKNSYRIGKANNEKSRPIIVEFTNYFIKADILKSTGKLKGTNVFINHDLTVEEIGRNRELRSYKKAAGKFKIDCKISKGKLVIGNKTFTVEELKNDPLGLFGNEATNTTVDGAACKTNGERKNLQDLTNNSHQDRNLRSKKKGDNRGNV